MTADFIDVNFWPLLLLLALAIGEAVAVGWAMLQTFCDKVHAWQVDRAAQGPRSLDQILASTWQETHGPATFHGSAAYTAYLDDPRR